MTANSKIEWTDHTFNPWIGCTKVSPACDHCYAEVSTPSRALGVAWGPHAERRRTSVGNWAMPKRWNAQAEAFQAQHGRRQRVFCASLADVFDNAVDREWRDDLATLILDTPNLDWLLLTKRIGNAGEMLGEMFLDGPPDNIWLGATIATQEEADRDIPKLLAVPAAKRFLSMEPLLSAVDLTPHLWGPTKLCDDCTKDADCMCGYVPRGKFGNDASLHWVIAGGESGANARPMHPDWARSLRDQCQAAGVSFFFKQWGEWGEVEGDYQIGPEDAEGEGFKPGRDCAITPDGRVFADPNDLPDDVPGRWMERLGKKAAGRLLDGREWNEVPA